MENIKCIYCNKNESDGIRLSESDIIPGSLTNKKIINRNVCEIDHNNKFGETFESDVINKLAFIRNQLGLKSKNGMLPTYSAAYNIEGEKYSFQRKNEYVSKLGHEILASKKENSKTLLGPIEKINKIKKHEDAEVEEVNLNGKNILIETELDREVFFSLSMKRMAAKIGYEWHCKSHNLNEVKQEYKDIIKFICTGESNYDMVNIVKYPDLYELLDKKCSLGSHSLIEYNYKGNAYVLLYFFGLLIYKIKVSNGVLYDPNPIYEEFKLDGTGEQIKDKKTTQKNLDLAVENILNNLSTGAGPVVIIKDTRSDDFQKSLGDPIFSNKLYALLKEEIEIIEGREDMTEILNPRIEKLIITYDACNILGYKNFLKKIDNIKGEKEKLLQKITNSVGVMNLYTIYILGKKYSSESVQLCGFRKALAEIHKDIKNDFFCGRENLDREEITKLREILNNDNDFMKYFIQGEEIVEMDIR